MSYDFRLNHGLPTIDDLSSNWRARAEDAEARLVAIRELADAISRDSHCGYLGKDIRFVADNDLRDGGI